MTIITTTEFIASLFYPFLGNKSSVPNMFVHIYDAEFINPCTHK